MIYLGGVGLAFFLTLLLFTKRKKNTADKVLAAWLLLMTIHLLLYYFRIMSLYPQLLAVDMPLPLIHGPFLYLYVSALTKGKISWRNLMVHFAPALLVLLYLIPFFALSTEEKIYIYAHEGVGYETFTEVRYIAIVMSGLLYVALSMIALHRHRQSIVHQFSSTDKINLQWLQYLIYWLGLIWLLVIFGNDELIYSATVLFILFIGFFGIKQVGIFHSPNVELTSGSTNISTPVIVEQHSDEDSTEKRKYKKSGLDEESANDLHRRLTLVMTTEKLFRQSELSLTDLAERLETPPNYLSQVINAREGKNFYDYINTLRVEEFKLVVANPESRRFTLMGLAEECGFNSKSSFNRYFKKVTGKSPSEFVENRLASEN